MKQTKTLKKFAMLLIATLSIFILASCSSGDKTPYGSISADTTYIEINNQKVTQKELYDVLRFNATDHILNLFDKQTFKDELDSIDYEKDEDLIQIEKSVNSTIFGQTELKAIAKLSEVNIAKSIAKYVDNRKLVDPSVNVNDLLTHINDVVTTAIDTYNNAGQAEQEELNKTYVFGYKKELLEVYELAYAQRLFAKKQLDKIQEENKDKEKPDANYVSEESIVARYNSNYKGKFTSISSLIIRFKSDSEAELARYMTGIKANTQGNWYQLPDVSDKDTLNAIMTSPNGKAQEKAKSVIEDKNINYQKFLNNNQGILFTSAEYKTFYDSYVLNTEDDALLSDDEVLAKFVEIYNYLNETSYDATDLETLKNDFTFTYSDSLFSTNSSLRDAVYALRKSIADENEEDAEAVNPYSKGTNSYGGTRFLLYFFDIEEDTNILITVPDEDSKDKDAEKEIFNDTELAKEYHDKILAELLEEKLSSSFISAQIDELYEEAKFTIYDPLIRTIFNFDKDITSKGGFKDNDTLATLTLKSHGKDLNVSILVDDLYNELEKIYGMSTAIDKIFNQMLLSSDKYTVSAEKRKELEDAFKNVLNNFSSDQLASSGFPKSMGQKTFLLVAFNAKSNKEAFENQYILSELRSQYEKDLEGTFENASIYKKFAQIAGKAYTENKGASVSHLLVYVDLDFDGSPDDPSTLTPEQRALFTTPDVKYGINGEAVDAITGLINLIKEAAKSYSTITTGISSVVSKYNSGTRFELLPGYLDYALENKFVVFQKLGLQVKYESLGNVTNETNFPTSSSGLDTTFYNYVMTDVLDYFSAEDFNEANLPHVFTTPRSTDNTTALGLETAFGWHTLIGTASFKGSSAISESESELYTSEFTDPTITDKEVFLKAYNEEDTLTYQQIAIYLKESGEATGVESLPSSVQTAITTYFTPVKNLYDSDNMSLYLSLRFVFGGDYTIKNGVAGLQERLDNLILINENQFFSYSIINGDHPVYTTASKGNEYFANVYGDWFTIFK